MNHNLSPLIIDINSEESTDSNKHDPLERCFSLANYTFKTELWYWELWYVMPIEASTNKWRHYEPKKVSVKTSTKSPALLVLNDRYHPDWKVSIDGKIAPLLRCNHLMRGVFVPEGEHEVTFEFAPSSSGLYAGLFAWISAIGILGVGIRERTTLNKTSVIGASINDPK